MDAVNWNLLQAYTALQYGVNITAQSFSMFSLSVRIQSHLSRKGERSNWGISQVSAFYYIFQNYLDLALKKQPTNQQQKQTNKNHRNFLCTAIIYSREKQLCMELRCTEQNHVCIHVYVNSSIWYKLLHCVFKTMHCSAVYFRAAAPIPLSCTGQQRLALKMNQ